MSKDEEVYYHNSFLKPYFECDKCNATILLVTDGDETTSTCPWCGDTLIKQYALLVFTQTNNYPTVSC